MPTALSLNSFAELVQRSRLMTADQLQQAIQELTEEGTQVDSPEALADALVQRGLLTSWQVGFLLKGKHQGFFLGSYRFLKMLGKGGMGAVYLAEHQMMRRRCAIKVLPSKLISDSSSVLERFYLEAQAVAALDDPNIVRAYDVNKEMQGKREIHYLVMEYVDGCDLQTFVQRKGPLDYIQVADFSRQTASGLAHAHESGLIHRDIKPANLLVDERGTVKILDLGLARFFDDGLDASLTTTHNESILGTADYLSPEQALDSHNVDTRTDIYSLGCTCYYMLTGHPPFPDGSVAQRLMSHQAKSPTAIEKIRPDVPGDLVTIVEKMIAKSPDNRYQTAREVVDAFTAWLAKHADEDWKNKHREIIDGSATAAHHEPTRARSSAAEDTDLALGLAPTEDVGLDQLEVLDPLTTDFDTGSPSGGLDNLLNEALDNYPAIDSNPNLATYSPLAGTPSGIYGKAKPATRMSAESNQLLKLVLIGFAVSVPLSVVILVVSSRFSTPAQAPPRAVSSGTATENSPRTSDELVSETPQSTSPAAPAAGDAEPARTEHAPTPTAANEVEPSPQPAAEPTPAPPMKEEEEPPTEAPETVSSPAASSPAASSPKPNATPTPSSEPPTSPPPSNTPPTTPDADRDDPSDVNEPEAGPPSPERIKELLAGLSEVTVTLDRKPNQKALAYDYMVVRTATEALERAGLKVTAEAQDASSAVLTLSFEAEKVESYIVFNLGAELKCRDEDSQEVVVWKRHEEVAKVSAGALGPTPPSVLRNKVSSFYIAFIGEYKRAVADRK
ncbi:MAG: protein kinase [Pirellulaceae bacterium]